MSSDTQIPVLDAAETTGPLAGAPPRPPLNRRLVIFWWLGAIVLVAAAAWVSYLVAKGVVFSTAHRAAAAWTGLLVVVALGRSCSRRSLPFPYQARTGGPDADSDNLAFRRRGLSAAVMGQDGRASTSKTQVVLWTAAVVWALVDLLLLARAYHAGTLFTNAVTSNWHPEYLVLLGLPVAAATTAKAVVASANSGHGPVSSKQQSLGSGRTYVRDSVPDGVRGILTGVAELITGDDGAVAWADLQYVNFDADHADLLRGSSSWPGQRTACRRCLPHCSR